MRTFPTEGADTKRRSISLCRFFTWDSLCVLTLIHYVCSCCIRVGFSKKGESVNFVKKVDKLFKRKYNLNENTFLGMSD